ncbi:MULTISPECIES: PadR family transcriptional regulator [unclassified Paenibacillus]|uniref:PadR family transcriptional regulator n=1 Tax=unclassified Paenibacillus TaxID=185978 RepID=UPI000953BB1C|nr:MULTISPECIES: PadR family transcriptional regulator [unclassified Paenibacillus]ASS67153.1 helix-turn-helix transcriptional regulator [Paenibacillus sp. RUD330]SIQ88066.1 Transcriptional regulator PadR-like family protein [Paenibacillus sp. RU4X]SIR09108.1 Transcriptional regulator PadR-like family protein [Paenibacillus sp. RU4T]
MGYDSYSPMSETAFYTLLSLLEVRHGYGIMQHVEELTGGRIRLGAGTIYGSLSRMDKDGLIAAVAEEERRKLYRITDAGKAVLGKEIDRIGELYHNAKKAGDRLNG